MYESFFGLSDLPFRLTPDPKFLFMSAKHREAFAHLLYGISEGSGFVAITGEVGAGKTTLIRALLAQASKDITVVSIVNPVLTSTELLQTVNAELGLPSRSNSRKELLEELAAFLQRNKGEGRRTVMIVDEAQNLDPVVLEQIRLLSNLETETEKLMQIVLVGQPELQGLLQRHDLRQLNQRVTERWHLDKLDRDESFEYVRHRLRIAGAEGQLFDPKALELVYRYTGGVPRLMNILGHRAMLVAFTRSRGRVGAPEVAAAAGELSYAPQVAASAGRNWRAWILGGAVAAAAAAVAFVLMTPASDELGRPVSPRMTRSREFAVAPAAAPALPRAVDPAPAARESAQPPEQAAPPIAAADPAVSPAPPAAASATPAANVPLDAIAPVAEPAASALPSAAAVPSQHVLPESAASAAPIPAPAAGGTVVASATATALGPDQALAVITRAPMFDGAVADYSRLLALWEAGPVAQDELAAGTLDLEAIASARGLRYLSIDLNEALLALLDLPAMLELRLPGEDSVRYVLMDRIDTTRATVRLAGEVTVSSGALRQWWSGRAHILWKDTAELRRDLGPGTGGPAVHKLQGLLAQAGVLQTPPTSLYDELTENAVRRFQESKHIVSDGIAGPITQILLNNSLGNVRRPTLGGDRT